MIVYLFALVSLLLALACQPEASPKNTLPSEHLLGERYEDRKIGQESLRRALAQLEAFDGDGQLRIKSGSFNGSVFWFNKSTIMTNRHVVGRSKIEDLEYIAFSKIVFFNSSLKQKVYDYTMLRLARANNILGEARGILLERIENLRALKKRSPRLEAILESYQADLKALEAHKLVDKAEIVFIPFEEAIAEIFVRDEDHPDIALIKLTKPIDELIAKRSSSLAIKDSWFAQNNLYDPAKHGFLYAGTPIYLSGYGRGLDGSPTDKNKSLKALRLGFLTSKDWVDYLDSYELILPPNWKLEKEFYYFEPESTPGDSGARLWAYADTKGRISQNPLPLRSERLTIGINTGTGTGLCLSQDMLQDFLPHMNHPPLVAAGMPMHDSALWHYLLNFEKPVSSDFIKNTILYVLYRQLLVNRLFDAEESYLWHVLYLKLSLYIDIAELGSWEDFISDFEKALFDHFAKAISFSPSELTEEQWAESLLHSNVLTDAHKQLFKKMTQKRLFDALADNFTIKLKNVDEPIKLNDYLDALSQWVASKKYQRQENYGTSTIIEVPDAHRSYAKLEDLMKNLLKD